MNRWNVDDARNVYGFRGWAEGYFDVADNGELLARGRAEPESPAVSLYAVARAARDAGYGYPVLLRFTAVLQDRIERLHAAFRTAIAGEGYRGDYTAVYPIKVNQQRSVVESIVGVDDRRVGLEAGSKPELMIVLAMAPRNGVIICNGYKDREYIRLALIGRALGHRVHIVVEKQSELDLILEESAALGIEPLLGLRVRLASIGVGKWQNTGGEKSKFGLSATQVLDAVERLEACGQLHTLALLHFHLGSQIANIRDIQAGVREGARIYAALRERGVPLQTVDIGGGLGVDYDGTRSRGDCSMNYTVDEYAQQVVHTFREVCEAGALPHPHLISESGRAMVAHHAVLVTNVTDVERVPDTPPGEAPAADEPTILHDLWRDLGSIGRRPALELYHEAAYAVAEAQSMFVHGVLSLEQRARAEQLYQAICHRVRPLLSPAIRAHREVLDELNDKLADKYFCNFSVFQSVPDVWGIGQIFPIVPLHRLNELPGRRGVLHDLTCDSDGRIDEYVDQDGVESTLRLHPWEGDDYLLGLFMVGAYQEILGDMHNLFGDTDSVNVIIEPDGGFRLEQARRGDTVDGLLRYVDFSADTLRQRLEAKAAEAIADSELRQRYLATLAEGLTGYTYLEG